MPTVTKKQLKDAELLAVSYIREYISSTSEEDLSAEELIDIYIDEFNVAMALFNYGYNLNNSLICVDTPSIEDNLKRIIKAEAMDIIKMARNIYGNDPNSFGGQRDGFINGYKQCLKDFGYETD